MIGMSSVRPTADAVEREHGVEHDDLADRADHGYADNARRARLPLLVACDMLVQLHRRLPDQEQPAGDQDEVAPREGVTEQRDHGARLRRVSTFL
jgi:hypothetical protein